MRVSTSELVLLAFSLAIVACSSESGSVAPAQGGNGSAKGGAGGQAGATPAGGNGGYLATAGASGSGGTSTTTGGSGAGGTGGTASAGSGNAGQSDGGATTVIVGACDGLGALDEVENITPPGTSYVTFALTDPTHAGTVYIGTNQEGVHKSTNCGADWTKVNTGTNGSVLDSGTQWSMALDPVNPDVIYANAFQGSMTSLLRSTNGGVDWESAWKEGSNVANGVEYGGFVQEVALDPTNHAHAVVSFHANCLGEFAPQCMGESTDSGVTWRLFKGPAGGWSENARPLILGGGTFFFATLFDGMFYTSDSGASWENVANSGRRQLYHAADGYYYCGGLWGINRSSDGHDWESIDGAPEGTALIGDGSRMFASCTDNCTHSLYAAPESDGESWTAIETPEMHGASVFAHDSEHHVLYLPNTESGLWRMVTE